MTVVFALIWVGMSVSPAAAQSWSNGYVFRRAITIDHTKVPNTDQSNFPVLISGTYSYLATAPNGGDVTSLSGYDIIFTSDAAGTTVLPDERESYNYFTGAVLFWVKAPTLSHTTDTVIYMFYGNGSITTDQSNKMGVWDANYKGVWHLANGTQNRFKGLFAAMMEGLALGVKAGLDPMTIYEVVKASSGGSKALERIPRAIVPREFEPGFKVALMNKDLETFTAIAKDLRVPVAFVNVAQRYEQMALAAGLGEQDTSVVMTVIERLSAVQVPRGPATQ